MKVKITFFFLFVCMVLKSQGTYPTDYFRSPLDIPLVLAGTFGELRSNHFHAGIDIKTQQRQGLPVYAVADGTVSRINVALWGYGKALYLAHPNGYTSVYAHLQKFSPEIEAYIKKLQYAKKSYTLQTYPDFGELSFKKGDIIAYTGNTGGSSGPHLHFEIRSSISEKPTNPLLYGLEVRDATNPVIEGLFAYPLGENAQVNQSGEKLQIPFKKQPDGSFLAEDITASGTIGFGIITYDRQDLAANRNGVYRVEQRVNGNVFSSFRFESFSFGETRYINTLIDYEHYGAYRDRIQKCFKDNGNHLSIYDKMYNQGKINVEEGMDYNIEINVTDLAGNLSQLIIPVRGRRSPIKVEKTTSDKTSYLLASKPATFDLGGAKVFFPANTFYKDFNIDLKKGKDTVVIHNPTAAAHRNYTLTFDVSGLKTQERKQSFIAHLDSRGKPQYMRTYKRQENFSTRTRTMGVFTIAKDTVSPKIQPKNFKPGQWLNNYRYLSFKISDDLSGINSYEAYLNGRWILMEYEPKTATITYNFDDRIADSRQCVLKLIVKDNVGNTSNYEATFFRK